jgi:hypothetical protein
MNTYTNLICRAVHIPTCIWTSQDDTNMYMNPIASLWSTSALARGLDASWPGLEVDSRISGQQFGLANTTMISHLHRFGYCEL